MKALAKDLLKNTLISFGCTIGTFGGIVVVSQIISELEKKLKAKKEETEEEELLKGESYNG